MFKMTNSKRFFSILVSLAMMMGLMLTSVPTFAADTVLYETNFGVTLLTCGNQRTLTSFLGFKKCSLDGLVTLVDAPYRVYDNTVQYRRYLRSKAKREQAV